MSLHRFERAQDVADQPVQISIPQAVIDLNDDSPSYETDDQRVVEELRLLPSVVVEAEVSQDEQADYEAQAAERAETVAAARAEAAEAGVDPADDARVAQVTGTETVGDELAVRPVDEHDFNVTSDELAETTAKENE